MVAALPLTTRSPYSQYDQYKTPMENIGLQDSLLSRFDLLFIVLDQMDPEQDREISDHVLRMHRYRGPNEQDGDGEFRFPSESPMHCLKSWCFFITRELGLLSSIPYPRTLQ